MLMLSEKTMIQDLGESVENSGKSHSSTPLLAADHLAVGFLSLSGLLLLTFAVSETVYLIFGLGNLAGAWLIWQGAKRTPGTWFAVIFRIVYPLAVIAVTHLEVELFIHLIYGMDFTFDALISGWDNFLFGMNPHLHFHTVLTQWYWVELMHLFYLNYYFLLIGSLTWVYLKRNDDFARFVFVYLGIFLTFVVIYSFFPVIGPVSERGGIFPETGWLTSLVDFLFLIGAPDGAAFPSSHVGQSVGIFLLLQPIHRYAKTFIGLVILGIGVSMIYVFIHYAIDAIAGLFAGWLLYHLWNRFYHYLKT